MRLSQIVDNLAQGVYTETKRILRVYPLFFFLYSCVTKILQPDTERKFYE